MAENNKRVGRVINIDGTKLMYTRKYSSGTRTHQAYVGMTVCIGDIFETGEVTNGTLEFDIGGQAKISPNTRAQVVGLREIDVLGNVLLIKGGKFWAKIDKQKSQLQIQTGGGVIGVEG